MMLPKLPVLRPLKDLLNNVRAFALLRLFSRSSFPLDWQTFEIGRVGYIF
jgi:hypothetical protein